MIRRPPRSTPPGSSAASDVYKRQILFIANRVTPAFRFCISNSTLTQVSPIRYYFLSLLSHIIVTPTNKNEEKQNLCLHFLFCCAIIPLAVADVAVRDPGVAQLVARLTGGQEAVSSSLATRTKKCLVQMRRAFFVSVSLSSQIL